MVTCWGWGSRRGCWDREGRSTWSGWSSLKVLAGLAKEEKYPNFSCDLKKKKSQQGGCVPPSERPSGREKGTAHEHLACGRLECRAGCLGKGILEQGPSSEPETSVAACWFPTPQPPGEGKSGLSTHGLILVPCGAGLMPGTPPAFIYLSKRLGKPLG